MNPRFPVYIISKGRWESRFTARHFELMGVPYRIVVEAQERDAYAAVIDPEKILVLDPAYQQRYDPCDGLGNAKSKGSGPARNFAWEHSIAEGYDRHWIVDDNINGFYRINHNRKVQVADGTIFRAMEDFVLRYKNVALAGPQYDFLVPTVRKMPVVDFNTRVFSCILILNKIPIRWRGRYNEDVILSVDVLKRGWCTCLFYAFLQKKLRTQSLKGGNTDELYKDGTWDKSMLLKRLFPDMVSVRWKYGRWHHKLNFGQFFDRNKLIRAAGVSPLPAETDEYGMKFVKLPRPVGRQQAIPIELLSGTGAQAAEES